MIVELVVLLVIIVLLVLNIYFVLAPRGWFFTIVPEGRAKAVVKMGSFEKFLIQWKGFKFDSEWNVVPGEERHHPFGGLRWVGIPPFWEVYRYKFSWTGVDVNGELIPHKKEELDYVLLMEDVYWAKISAAEDKDSLPLDIELLVTMKVVNPYKALFQVQNWSEMVMNRLKPLFREYVAGSSYQDLLKKKTEAEEKFYQMIGTIAEEEFENYGVQIVENGIEIKNIDPTPVEGIPSIREVTLRKYVAEKDRERILVEADAERQKILTLADAEQERIKTVYGAVQDMGETGKLIRSLEMLEKSTGEGTRWVILPGGITEMISQVLPGRINGPPAPDGGTWLSKEELKALQKEISALESLSGEYVKKVESKVKGG